MTDMTARESASATSSLARTGRCPRSIFQIVAWLNPKPRSVIRCASSSWLRPAASR